MNLSPNPFIILATVAVVNHEHDDNYSPQSPEPSEPSPISTPPMNVSTFLTTGRRLTRRLMTTRSTPMMNPGMYIFRLLNLTLTRRRHPEGWKENWAWKGPFPKEGECRNTPAKPADGWSPQQRTFQVHQPRTRTLKTLKLQLRNW